MNTPTRRQLLILATIVVALTVPFVLERSDLVPQPWRFITATALRTVGIYCCLLVAAAVRARREHKREARNHQTAAPAAS